MAVKLTLPPAELLSQVAKLGSLLVLLLLALLLPAFLRVAYGYLLFNGIVLALGIQAFVGSGGASIADDEDRHGSSCTGEAVAPVGIAASPFQRAGSVQPDDRDRVVLVPAFVASNIIELKTKTKEVVLKVLKKCPSTAGIFFLSALNGSQAGGEETKHSRSPGDVHGATAEVHRQAGQGGVVGRVTEKDSDVDKYPAKRGHVSIRSVVRASFFSQTGRRGRGRALQASKLLSCTHLDTRAHSNSLSRPHHFSPEEVSAASVPHSHGRTAVADYDRVVVPAFVASNIIELKIKSKEVVLKVLKKCPSTASIFFLSALNGCQAGGEEKGRKEEQDDFEVDDVTMSRQELFANTERFIGNFRKELRMQRQ
uniref:DUF4408 domain-containing protein n=1 Tax=Aegilops tauschii TaxID=37682 RepID=M8B5M2_AEGTA